ncbi:DUF5388 domain-containing protein [Levilactobacillus brevis]|uniref:DUF5388 domain-containing protein n=1 Tax=Levilactobacillus brevis TaxID=1580 RepID=A0AA41ES40_LEVBR|nr:DUF5388 domain-containing protein [Levilactobacillus brevis]MBS0948684.1 DUF5388 domain-containing protein [Levilactobacillus brevis]MBS1007096.1 DUF5388 domain-containing protein [Levilactobacillus brevis]MBS1011850.1 DUF5388 domain-containing protein [Levilactobacillus brevis]MBS1014279.1 DUF5388 domain-containing protein [Levilactobacillus brevis]
MKKKRATIIFDEDVSDKPISVNKTVDSVTFDTNLKINNHIRNKLQAMAVLGYSDNQKAAIEVALSVYIESLTSDERKELEFQIDSLEKRDVRVKSK